MRRWFFLWNLTFTWIAKRTLLECCQVFLKFVFFEILELLHYVSTTNMFGWDSKHVCGADIVQKCEDFKKIIFFRKTWQHSSQVRFAIHVKVSFHGKNQRLIYFLEGCNLTPNRAMFKFQLQNLRSHLSELRRKHRTIQNWNAYWRRRAEFCRS